MWIAAPPRTPLMYFNTIVGLTREYLPQCRIELYTNGVLLTEERLVQLSHLGIDKFTVTRHHAYRGEENYSFSDLYPQLPEELRKKIKFQNILKC